MNIGACSGFWNRRPKTNDGSCSLVPTWRLHRNSRACGNIATPRRYAVLVQHSRLEATQWRLGRARSVAPKRWLPPCGGARGVARTRRSRRSGRAGGGIRARRWRRCDGACGVVSARKSRRNSRSCSVVSPRPPCREVWARGIFAARRSRWRSWACSVVRAWQSHRWSRAWTVVRTRRSHRWSRACNVVPAWRSHRWSRACDNIATRCRRAILIQHSRITRQWRLGGARDLRLSRQQNQQKQHRNDYDCSSRPGSLGHCGNLAHRG